MVVLSFLGCNQWSTNSDIFSIMLLQLDTIGLIPIGFFECFVGNIVWIFFFDFRCKVENSVRQK